MRDWFRGRQSPPISKLLDLAERLPRHSVYAAAVADDDDTALALLSARDDAAAAEGRPRFGMYGWTYERELLVGQTDLLMSIRSLLIGAKFSSSGKPPKVDPMPRPRTARDRIEAIQSRRKRQNLLGQLVPGGPTA